MQHHRALGLLEGSQEHVAQSAHFLLSVFIMLWLGLRRCLLQGGADGSDLSRAELNAVGHGSCS